MMEEAQEDLSKSLKDDIWEDSRTISSGSDRTSTSSRGSSAESFQERHPIVTPFDYLDSVPPKISVITSLPLIKDSEHNDFSSVPMSISESNSTSVSSSTLSAESDIEAEDISNPLENTDDVFAKRSSENIEDSESSDSPFPVLIEAADHPIHSPTPQRRYRSKVTASYEPPPLPLYAHEFNPSSIHTQPVSFAKHSHYPWAHSSHPSHLSDSGESSTSLSSQNANQFTELDGFENLANSYVEDGTRPAPLYRRFQILNHRVLLHLQDEISRMEKSLFDRDEEIRKLSDQLRMRAGSEYNGRNEMAHEDIYQSNINPSMYGPTISPIYGLFSSQLDMRTELLGRTFLKLGQYNQALVSYSAATGRFSRANEAEISAFKEWASDNPAIQNPNWMKFLDSEEDLISVNRPIGKETKSETNRNIFHDTHSDNAQPGSTSNVNTISSQEISSYSNEEEDINSSQIQRVAFDVSIVCALTALAIFWIGKEWTQIGMVFAFLLVLSTILREIVLSY